MAAVLSTSFAVAVTDWASAWQFASVSGVQIGYLCVAESELAQVTRVGPGTMVQVRRGVEGTASAAHPVGTPVAVYVAGQVDTDAPVLATAAVPMRQATVTLSHTQILALRTPSPVTIVPAPGANRLVVPLDITLLTRFTAGYTGAAIDDSLDLVIGPKLMASLRNIEAPPGGVDIYLTYFLSSTSPAYTHLQLPQLLKAFSANNVLPEDVATEHATNTNQPLEIEMAGGVIAGGAAANTLTVSVLYAVLDTTTGVWV